MARILIVENDATLAELLQWALRQDGYDVTVALHASDAIELGVAEPPDLILTDWMLLHSMHGGNVSKAIRDVCPWTKTIVITGHPEIVRQAWAWGDYIDLVIEKPFHMRHLLGATHRVLHETDCVASSFSYQ